MHVKIFSKFIQVLQTYDPGGSGAKLMPSENDFIPTRPWPSSPAPGRSRCVRVGHKTDRRKRLSPSFCLQTFRLCQTHASDDRAILGPVSQGSAFRWSTDLDNGDGFSFEFSSGKMPVHS